MSTPEAAAGLMPRLREATAEQHRELEAWVDPARRFATRESYTAYLLEIYALFVDLETTLATLPWRTISFDLDERRKAPLLEKDLRFFGLDPAAAHPPAMPLRLESLAAGFGCQYVLEGSTLGGQMILAGLEKRGIGPDSGAAFFACYRERTPAMWKSFKEAATAWCADEERVAEAIDAARCTFVFYQRGVSPLG